MKRCILPVVRFSTLLWFLLAWAWSKPSHAGTFYSVGVGGSWQPLTEPSRQIRLVEQEIHVTLPSRRVEVRSVFCNDGAPIVAEMGFPESGQVNETTPLPQAGFIVGRRSTVDGKPLKTARLIVDDDLADREEFDEQYEIFWMAKLPFQRGQTHVVRDVFTSGPYSELMNAPEAGFRQHFGFDCRGAADWRGPIGRLHVVFDAPDWSAFSELQFQPKALRKGAVFEWQAHDVKPKIDLNVSWWPGLRQFEIDGKAPLERCLVLEKTTHHGEPTAVYPHLYRGKVWVPLRLLQMWLPPAGDGSTAQIQMPPRRTFMSLEWGARAIFVAPTSDTIDCNRDNLPQGEEHMNAPAFFERGALMVELAPAVRALGGEVVVSHGVIGLWMRESPP